MTTSYKQYGDDTSGGGGGGGGGFNLYDAELLEANLSDGTWTLYDPGNLIKSVAYDATSKRNVITVNALASGNNPQYNWKNSGAKEAPRWHKAAQIGTENINREHMVTGIYLMDFSDDREMSCDVVCGLAKIPESEVATGVNLGGAFGQISAQAYANYGVYTFSGATFLSTQGPQKGLCSFQHGGDVIGGGVAALLDSSGESLNSGISRASSQAHTDNGRPMSVLVGLGLRNNNTPWDQDDVVKIGIKYLLLRPSLS
jgi:hypothetical protein